MEQIYLNTLLLGEEMSLVIELIMENYVLMIDLIMLKEVIQGIFQLLFVLRNLITHFKEIQPQI